MQQQTFQDPTAVWENYYAELDPEQRKKLLEQGCQVQPEDPLNPLRRELWELRYTDPKNPQHRVDSLLWQCVNLLYIYKASGPRFLRKSGVKEIQTATESMGESAAKPFGQEGLTALYWEFRNAARRYFTVCSGDKSYHKRAFGILSISKEEARKKLTRDAWRLSEGLASRFNLHAELHLFSRAVKDEYFAEEEDAPKLWELCEASQGKKF